MAESMLRKGQSHQDGTYDYTCGCSFKDPECPYCYGGDLKRCQAAIKIARGQIYYGLLKTILHQIGYLANKFDLNYKATFEWLEEIGRVPTGTYERVMEGRPKVRDILSRAKDSAVCYERGRHEVYMLKGDKIVCRQCGKTFDEKARG